MKSYLKVKIKSLAAEAAIIRLEERRAKRRVHYAVMKQLPEDEVKPLEWERQGLHHHRTYHVRTEARAAQLAYALIRNVPYKRVEPNATKGFPGMRVKVLVAKYGAMGTRVKSDAAVDAWRAGLPPTEPEARE